MADAKAVAQLRVFDIPADGDGIERKCFAEALCGASGLPPGVYRLVLHPVDAAGVAVVPAATLKEEFVAELVAGLRRAEEKRKQGIAALPPGTCATCMGEGFLGSIESQRVTDCPDCVGGRTRGVKEDQRGD